MIDAWLLLLLSDPAPPMPPPPQQQPNEGKVTPNPAMDAEATHLLSLTVLQGLDPAIKGILITAAHVTLYEFNIDINQWGKLLLMTTWKIIQQFSAGELGRQRM